ncbi:hypothetical protein ACIBL3_46485 [Kribbella sp. NPDC050124]|uniref:hypothetical protein n=1 Tax=Kribbella sp. NPDC050124 TaxID=3364114 RepID=UPI00379463C5
MARSARNKASKKDGSQNERRWIDRLITVAVAILAVIGGYIAAQFDAKEDREKEAREIQAQVYREYLKSTVLYRDSSYRAWKDYDRYLNKKINYETFRPVLKAWEDARRNYQDNVDQVSVHGSLEAQQAGEKISSSMLPSLEGTHVNNIPPSSFEKAKQTKKNADPGPDYAKFSEGYRDFVYRFCVDVAPVDDPQCTQG